MNIPELADYWRRMNHAKERLAVLHDQLADFVAEVTSYDERVKFEIERDDRVYYVRLGG